MKKVKEATIVPYTCEQMYDLVNDVKSYPKFLPWCKETKILSKHENEMQATIYLSKGIFSHNFTTKNTLKKNELIDMKLVDGPFSHLEGFWHFKPIGENKCKITFELEFSFVTDLFAVALNPIFHSILAKFVESFKNRAKEIYG